MFESYDGGHPVNEIAVRDKKRPRVALWQDDDLRLRLAAGDMLEAWSCASIVSPISRGSMTARRRSAPSTRRARRSPGPSQKRLPPQSLEPRNRSRPIRKR